MNSFIMGTRTRRCLYVGRIFKTIPIGYYLYLQQVFITSTCTSFTHSKAFLCRIYITGITADPTQVFVLSIQNITKRLYMKINFFTCA